MSDDKHYWSFPEYKVAGSTEIELLNFPDSNLYLIGFKYRNCLSAKLRQLEVQPDGVKTSTSNPLLNLEL